MAGGYKKWKERAPDAGWGYSAGLPGGSGVCIGQRGVWTYTGEDLLEGKNEGIFAVALLCQDSFFLFPRLFTN